MSEPRLVLMLEDHARIFHPRESLVGHFSIPGAAAGEDVEISAGLTEGETVVARGGFDVREGDRVAGKQKSESRKQEWKKRRSARRASVSTSTTSLRSISSWSEASNFFGSLKSR